MLLSLALLSFSLSNAQEVKFGAKAGLNLSTISIEVPQVSIFGSQAAGEEQKNSFALGFHVGGFAELLLSDKFSVQAELLYSRQGSKLESNDVQTQDFGFAKTVTTANTKTEVKTAYLNIPLLAKYYVTEKLFVAAGPQFGLLLTATSGSTGTGTTVATFGGNSTTTTKDINNPDTDTKSTFNSLNIAVGLGGGYFITENLFAEARYNLGLTNDGKSTTLPFLGTIETKAKTSAIQVSLGFRF